MKKAVIYQRISEKDQSNNSLSGQEEINTFYAKSVDAEVVKSFEDDGASAKNFNRRGWKQCEAYLKKYKGKIDYLIIWKYDRFGRNLSESLAMIEKIEMRWNIKILASAEPIYLSPTDPYFFKERASRLLDAHFERLRISDRSKMGNWMAKSQGRFIGRAPFGFINVRNEQNKPDIKKDLSKEAIFKVIGDSFFIHDDELSQVANLAREAGYNRRGREAIKRLLTNPVYYGLLIVPAYKNHVENMVETNAGGWWPKSWYQVALDRMGSGNKKVSLRPELPLRGILKCPKCGEKVTGSMSRGKLGKYYPYYRCCKGVNFSATKADDVLLSILKQLSIPLRYTEILVDIAKKKLDEIMKHRKGTTNKLKKEINDLSNNIDKLEEKFIKDEIAPLTYKKWHGIYTRDIAGKEIELSRLESNDQKIYELFEENKYKLGNLHTLYESLGLIEKRKFFTLLFGHDVVMEQGIYRTPYILNLFKGNIQNIKELEVIGEHKKTDNNGLLSVSTPNASLGEPTKAFLIFISKYKIAS